MPEPTTTSYAHDARQIFRELRPVGIEVDSFAELRRLGRRYVEAIPILLRWLADSRDKDLKEDIVRSLSMPWAGPEVARVFVSEFERSDDLLLKWAIGNGLSIVADDSIADDVLRLAREAKHGRAREMVVVALARLKDSRAVAVAQELLSDPITEGHAVIALGQLKAVDAKDDIASRLSHPKAWVRAEAKKALAKLGG